MANDEMMQYLGVFLDEASEQIGLLEQSILELEHASTPELLQTIFRAAHTLKGSSRAMGFTSMGELMHAMEDVFDRLRQQKVSVTSGVVDTLFDALDTLKALKEEIAATSEASTDTTAQTERLRALIDPEQTEGTPVAELAARADFAGAGALEIGRLYPGLSQVTLESIIEARQAGLSTYSLAVSIAPDCVMKSVRALMVLQQLESIGSILATSPDEEGIENEAFDTTFSALLTTERPADEVQTLGSAIAEITGVVVTPLPEGDAKTPPGSLQTLPMAEPATPPSNATAPSEPAQQTEGKREPARTHAPHGQGQTVRVDVARLENLLNLVGELVIDQTRIARIGEQLAVNCRGEQMVEHLSEVTAHFARITFEMQEEIMKARMLPIDNVFSRFPRMVRDLTQALGKEIDFVVTGRETELDRSVIEVIGDPLIHILRNSIDHGIELPEERVRVGKTRTGSVWLRARHEENHIVIEIEDDGAGIDPNKLRVSAVRKGLLSQEAAARLTDRDAVNLIFTSGFSTAAKVSDVSGRGVGMDIVRNNLTRFGALLDISSRVGEGTRFTIKLPLTLAIIRGLLVKVGSGAYALPLASVLEALRVPAESIHAIHHREVIVHRELTLPLVRLQELFYGAVPRTDTPREEILYVVVVGKGDKQVGLVVDGLLGEQEIVIKPLGKFIGDVQGISGATILGDGRIALIVDINGLLSIATEERNALYAA